MNKIEKKSGEKNLEMKKQINNNNNNNNNIMQRTC
jgi:hypothetical protein